MKVGIIQSNFLPWRGYFDFIREADLFIFHDDVQYTKGDWRNRNKIKTQHGVEWITVPVKYNHTGQLIEETLIDYSTPWPRKMLNRLQESYRNAPHFEPFFSELVGLLDAPARSISELNIRLIRWVCGHLLIQTPLCMSHDYHPQGIKNERLIGILKQVKATTYLTGPAARDYIIPELFEREAIRLVYKKYDFPVYEQLYPPFEGEVSVIDLLFMTGNGGRNYLGE